MKLYDEIVDNVLALCSEGQERSLPVDPACAWPKDMEKTMILRGDTAYELGGSDGKLPALGATVLTDNMELVPNDELLLIGPDLPELKGDASYARIALVRVNPESMGEGNALYNAIRHIEYTRYHVEPQGFMVRVSTTYGRESVRVSKDAVTKGINFRQVGNLMLNEFHKTPSVQAVKLVLVTDPRFSFNDLEREIKKTETITKTIDHMLKNVMSDCNTCSLQEICDEIEGMRELHEGLSAE